MALTLMHRPFRMGLDLTDTSIPIITLMINRIAIILFMIVSDIFGVKTTIGRRRTLRQIDSW